MAAVPPGDLYFRLPVVAGVLLTISLLAFGCQNQPGEDAITEAKTQATPTAPEPVLDPSLNVATLLRFHPDPGRQAQDAETPPSWAKIRNELRPIEEELGISTILEDSIESASPDCGPAEWHQISIQRFPSVEALAQLLQHPDRARAMSSWDLIVADFHRVVGREIPPPARTAIAVTKATRDRILLVETSDREHAQRALTAESVFLEGHRGQVILQHKVPPELNEVGLSWDLFTVTRYASADVLDRPDRDLAAIRKQFDLAARRTCRLVGVPTSPEAGPISRPTELL